MVIITQSTTFEKAISHDYAMVVVISTLPGSLIYPGTDIGKRSNPGNIKKCVELKRVRLQTQRMQQRAIIFTNGVCR